MREIKFRAWDKEAEQLIYSDAGDDQAIWQIDHSGITVLTLQTVDSNPGGLGHHQENKYLPADVEVMQFTGLKDKNGKEIYEGDIIEQLDTRGYEKGVVEYRLDSFDIIWYDQCNHSKILKNNAPTSRVIGNIYEPINQPA